jgi:hypothetical protein
VDRGICVIVRRDPGIEDVHARSLMYDEGEHLLGQYSSSGALVQETVWMGDIPVATLRPNGSAISLWQLRTTYIWVHSQQWRTCYRA